MSSPKFVHLRVHTEYSLLEGAVRLKKLPQLCADAGMPAVAVTDTNNMFAALEFSVGAQGAGIQPIVGCQIDVQYEAAALGEAGVATGMHYPIPIHLQPAYEGLGQPAGSCPVAERAADEILSLPMYPELSDAQVERVCAAVREFF